MIEELKISKLVDRAYENWLTENNVEEKIMCILIILVTFTIGIYIRTEATFMNYLFIHHDISKSVK